MRTRPVAEPRHDPGHARVTHVRDQRRVGRARTHASNASSTASSSAKTSGWSHSALSSTATAGRYGSKLPAYSSASTTNSSPAPQRAVAGGPPVSLGVEQCAHERGRVAPAAHEQVAPASRWWSTCRASLRRPRAAGRWSRPRRRRPAARPRAGCRAARAAASSGWSGDRGERLRHGERPAGRPPTSSCAMRCAPTRRCPRRRAQRCTAIGRPGSQPVTTAPA